MDKKTARIRRAKKTRAKISAKKAIRLCVHKTPMHIYAQIISADGETVLASASTVEKAVQADIGTTSNISAASHIGKLIAERAKSKGVEKIAFDRSGFAYHGRIKALADSARECGLSF